MWIIGISKAFDLQSDKFIIEELVSILQHLRQNQKTNGRTYIRLVRNYFRCFYENIYGTHVDILSYIQMTFQWLC